MSETINQAILAWRGLMSAHPIFVKLAVFFAVVLLALLLRNLAGRGIVIIVSAIIQRFGVKTVPENRKGVRPAANMLFVTVCALVAAKALELSGPIAPIAVLLLQSSVVCCLFWLINAFIQAFLAEAARIRSAKEHFSSTWFPQVVRLVLIALMIVVVLKVWGIDLGPALTGIGIAGAAVALAGQDLIRNLIGGICIVGERRFKDGDWVRISPEIEGFVEKIDLRSTVIRRFDGGTEHVPNADLANQPLSNFSRRAARRLKWTVSLKYQTDQEKLKNICESIRNFIWTNALFVHDDAVIHVKIFGFTPSAIEILVDSSVAANDYATELEARHALTLAIKEAVEKAGAEFALPALTFRPA